MTHPHSGSASAGALTLDARPARSASRGVAVDREVAQPLRAAANRATGPFGEQDGVTRADDALVTVDADYAGSGDDNEQHIQVRVGVLDDTLARPPVQQGRVEILARHAPHRPLTGGAGKIDGFRCRVLVHE